MKQHPLSQKLFAQITEAIQAIRYGCVQITIHDSRIVQIEKVEKIRVSTEADLNPGGKCKQLGSTDRTTGGSPSSHGQ